jgi:hypothetical protein
MTDGHSYCVVAITYGAMGLLHSTRIARTTTLRAANHEQQMTAIQIKESDVVGGTLNYVWYTKFAATESQIISCFESLNRTSNKKLK